MIPWLKFFFFSIFFCTVSLSRSHTYSHMLIKKEDKKKKTRTCDAIKSRGSGRIETHCQLTSWTTANCALFDSALIDFSQHCDCVRSSHGLGPVTTHGDNFLADLFLKVLENLTLLQSG